MNVIIYGTNKSQDCKKALRFFKERNVQVQFFDLKNHIMSSGELNRFIQKYSLDALVDKTSKPYKKQGLEFMRVADEQMLDKLIDEPSLMVQPLVRAGKDFAVGWDETVWREWYKQQ